MTFAMICCIIHVIEVDWVLFNLSGFVSYPIFLLNEDISKLVNLGFLVSSRTLLYFPVIPDQPHNFYQVFNFQHILSVY